MVVPGAGGGDGNYGLNGCRVLVWDIEKILEMDHGDGCTAM
jgi:hypothetical protein